MFGWKTKRVITQWDPVAKLSQFLEDYEERLDSSGRYSPQGRNEMILIAKSFIFSTAAFAVGRWPNPYMHQARWGVESMMKYHSGSLTEDQFRGAFSSERFLSREKGVAVPITESPELVSPCIDQMLVMDSDYRDSSRRGILYALMRGHSVSDGLRYAFNTDDPHLKDLVEGLAKKQKLDYFLGCPVDFSRRKQEGTLHKLEMIQLKDYLHNQVFFRMGKVCFDEENR
jgi:hypothetical protein